MTKSIPAILLALNLTGLGLVTLSLPAAAQATDAQKNAIRSNCRSDFIAKCSSVTPGGVEAFECLKKNEATLSAGCKSAVNAINTGAPAQAKPAAATPAAPMAAPAGTTEPAPPKTKPATASAPPATKPAPQKPAPKPAVAAAPPPAADPAAPPPPPAMSGPRLGPLQEARLVREFCTTDFQVLCKGVRLGQGRALKCLNDNQPSLSPGCKNAMQMVR